MNTLTEAAYLSDSTMEEFVMVNGPCREQVQSVGWNIVHV